MGFKCNLQAFSPGVPRDDIWTHPEGGPQRAEEAVRHHLTDSGLAFRRTGTVIEGLQCPDGELWVSTFGETVLFGRSVEGPAPGSLPQGWTSWELDVHSVVDLCRFAVRGPQHDRVVELYADMDGGLDENTSGIPLPFEVAYLEGRHRDAWGEDEDDQEDREDSEAEQEPPFHPLDLGNAASLWIFGIEGETPPEDEVVTPLINRARETDVMELPMHHFALPTMPEQPRRKKFLGLF